MSILCLVCVWHSVVPLLHADEHPQRAVTADRIALGLLSFTYVFFHIFFFGWIYVFVSIFNAIVRLVSLEYINICSFVIWQILYSISFSTAIKEKVEDFQKGWRTQGKLNCLLSTDFFLGYFQRSHKGFVAVSIE